MNKQKGFIGAALILILGLAIGAGAVYFATNNNTKEENLPEQTQGETQSLVDKDGNMIDATANWQALIPQVQTIIEKAMPCNGAEPNCNGQVSISAKADITGDYKDEAFIAIPWGGGAASWFVALMRLENNSPTLAKYKDKDGIIEDAIILEAGSAGYSTSAHLAQPYKALVVEMFGQLGGSYDQSKMVYANGNYATCSIDVYAWNSQTQVFEWSEKLKTQLEGKIYCIKDGTPPMGV